MGLQDEYELEPVDEADTTAYEPADSPYTAEEDSPHQAVREDLLKELSARGDAKRGPYADERMWAFGYTNKPEMAELLEDEEYGDAFLERCKRVDFAPEEGFTHG